MDTALSQANTKLSQKSKEKSLNDDCDGHYDGDIYHGIMHEQLITRSKDKYLQIKWAGKDNQIAIIA